MHGRWDKQRERTDMGLRTIFGHRFRLFFFPQILFVEWICVKLHFVQTDISRPQNRVESALLLELAGNRSEKGYGYENDISNSWDKSWIFIV